MVPVNHLEILYLPRLNFENFLSRAYVMSGKVIEKLIMKHHATVLKGLEKIKYYLYNISHAYRTKIFHSKRH